jgi:predicted DNA-binding transcriptional regulator AlpA
VNPAGEKKESRLLTENGVAEQLNCSVALVRKWRRLGSGPKVVRIARLVRYQQSDVDSFIQTRKESAAVEKEGADVETENERAA